MFWRKKKSQQNLDEKATELSVRIISKAVVCVNTIDDFCRKEHHFELAPILYSQLIIEFIILFSHLSDREAFRFIGPEQRSSFMDILLFHIKELLDRGAITGVSPKFHKSCSLGEKIKVSPLVRKSIGDEDTEFISKVQLESILDIDELNERNIEYAKYMKLFPDKDESPKDTLFWEFGKHISEDAFGSSDDLSIIMLSIDLAAKSYIDLKITELLLGDLK